MGKSCVQFKRLDVLDVLDEAVARVTPDDLVGPWANPIGLLAPLGREGAGPTLEGSAVGAGDGDLAVRVAGGVPAAFVRQVVVVPADAHEVGGVGGTSFGPVLHVVEVADRPAAAGPPTSVVVAAADPATEPCRRVAGGSTDADRAALGRVEVSLDARVAAEPAQRVAGDGGAVDGGASLDDVPGVVEEPGGGGGGERKR